MSEVAAWLQIARAQKWVLALAFATAVAMVVSFDTAGAWAFTYLGFTAVAAARLGARHGVQGLRLARLVAITVLASVTLVPVAIFVVVALVYWSYGVLELVTLS